MSFKKLLQFIAIQITGKSGLEGRDWWSREIAQLLTSYTRSSVGHLPQPSGKGGL